MSSRFNLFHYLSFLRSPRLRRRHSASLSRSWERGAVCGTVQQLEARKLLAATPVAGAWTGGVFDHVGLFEDGVWQLDLDGDFFVGDDSPPFQFGQPGDLPVVGDWNGDGIHSVGVFRNGHFILDVNDNRAFDAGDLVAAFGVAGDRPVAGNWDGDAGDEIGIVRNAHWALDTSGNFSWGRGDTAFVFGLASDTPVTGNWNPATSRDGVGIFRNGTWAIDSNEDFRFTSADVAFNFGASNSRPFTGDFVNNNADEVGIITAGGTPFIRTIPAPIAAASEPSLAMSTATHDTTESTALAAASATADEDRMASHESDPSEDIARESLFTRENWSDLEQFMLTGTNS